MFYTFLHYFFFHKFQLLHKALPWQGFDVLIVFLMVLIVYGARLCSAFYECGMSYMVRLKDYKKHDFLGIWSYAKFVCEVVKSGKSNTRMTLLLNHKFNANTGII